MSNSTGEPNNNSPSKNSRGAIFDKEENSDVTFLVGYDQDTWRIPGHRKLLSQVNPVFRVMFEGPLAPGPVVRIKDVDGRAFDNLLRFLYKEDINLQSASTALLTLYAAHKYLCIELVKKCIMYLDENISVDNVLKIYQHLRLYSSEDSLVKIRTDGCLYQATAPPLTPTKSSSLQSILSTDHNSKSNGDLEVISNFSNNNNIKTNNNLTEGECGTDLDSINYFSVIDYYCSSLLFNCLIYIDQVADEVLLDESLENLTVVELREMLERDSLRVSSELTVFNALSRWCNSECKKLHLELTKENRRKVLSDDLLFTCRYLLMTSEEFLAGPMQSDFFDKPEESLLLSLIIKSSSWNIFKKQTCCSRLSIEILNRISSKRNTSPGYCYEPVPLSDRSRSIVMEPNSNRESTRTANGYANPLAENVKEYKVKKIKNKKRKSKEKEKNAKEKRCCGSRITDCMLRALICIFD